MNSTPVNVVTGQLGAGKTTVILNLIKQLPEDYKVVWLKNEYGDVNIDSDLAAESNIKTREVLNGCICCVLIGRLSDAVKEILTDMQPDRLIIETAGTAYPFPIIDKLAGVPEVKLDSLIAVVDALNFEQFDVKNQLAKDQAKYVDLVVINKSELVDNAKLEQVMDEVYDLYLGSPKVVTPDGKVDKDLIIGLDSNLVERIYHSEDSGEDHHHEHEDIEVFSVIENDHRFEKASFEEFIKSLNSTDFYRIKGILRFGEKYELLNYVAGRFNWEKLAKYKGASKITFMGRGIKMQSSKIQQQISDLRTN